VRKGMKNSLFKIVSLGLDSHLTAVYFLLYKDNVLEEMKRCRKISVNQKNV